ncbi:hypothetical protein ACRQEF_00705 [Actinotignum sp. GS-2025a]|uniref:hypothetical protein n=1 Tax=Actinotignum sp. GS-2025a TaxID=3427274 RepID=UPI003F44953F
MTSFIGPAASFTAGVAAPTIQRRFRKISKYPRQPRVFSQAPLLLPLGGVMTFASALGFASLVFEPPSERPDDAIVGIVMFAIMLPISLLIVWMGFARRFGVDNHKLWSRFTPVFYREISFTQITRVTMNAAGFRLYGSHKPLGVAINRFDYTLAYLRILEELKYRRFTVGDVAPHDPRWPQAAQELRNALAAEAYRNHQNYYDTHLVELHELTSLAQGR